MSELRDLDYNPDAMRSYLREAQAQYKRAKRDLGDASRSGVQSWIACAMRQLNFARAELRRAVRVTKHAA